MARAVFFRPVEIDGVFFAGGRESYVSPAIRKHWYFKALLIDKAAKLTLDDDPEPVKSAPHAEPVTAAAVEQDAPAAKRAPARKTAKKSAGK